MRLEEDGAFYGLEFSLFALPWLAAFLAWRRRARPALIGALQDDDAFVRWEVVEALERLGPDARAALPALRAALQDESEQVRAAAERALGRISP